MVKKFVFIILIMAVVCSFFVSAEKVAYTVKNNNQVVQKYVNILNNMGFTVDIIEKEYIPTTNFSEYSFLLVNDDYFSNIGEIPINEMPALILNTWNVEDFHWAYYAGTVTSSGFLQGNINDPNNFITKDLTNPVNLFTTNSLSVNYLPKQFKAVNLKTVLSLVSDNQDAIIATAMPGTKLRDKVYANAKGVFFGINNHNYWTNQSEQLFRKSALWLITDVIPPEIFNISVEDITNASAKIKWGTNKDSNSTVFYGEDLNLSLVETNADFVKAHELLLEGLEELTTYYYKLKSCNKDGYCNESSVSDFTTEDLTPPYLVSKIVSDITNSSVNVSVVTSENAQVTVFYGTNELVNSVATSSFNIESALTIDGLSELTQYYYVIEMCDIYANCANSSVFDFTTLDITTPPMPENLMLEVINSNNNIKVKWSSPSEDADHYNIYIADSLTSFDFENPDASTTSLEYIDSGASAKQKRYYVVRAEDSSGNEEENENILSKFDLSLVAGYNLVSFPLTPFDANVNKVMHQNNSYKRVSEIKKYDVIDKEFKTIDYNNITNEWNTTINFNELEPLEGYFFKANQNTQFTIVGYPISEISLDLAEGLNLVGLTLIDTKQIEEAVVQSPSDFNATEIVSRNNDGSYDIASYYGAIDSWFKINDFDIQSGRGYWVKANKDFSLVVS